ncbi:MAG: signal recognition particle protein [Anaerolineales bacterium]|nr:signal recognition particle protein [Anaerolineales bacterium]
MFENLTGRLSQVFNDLRRKPKLSEADVENALREVRLALLEADVHYDVAQDFLGRVKTRAVGHEVSRALNPAQQVIKIVHEELISTLGNPEPLKLSGSKPYGILMVGLQGAGKTTAVAKIAKQLRAKGERVLLVAGDPYRPAAVEQLQTLGQKVGVEVLSDTSISPVRLAKKARQKAQNGGYSVCIIDTAGRSQLDDELMQELQGISKELEPVETLLVVDAMIGQEAVNVAQGFRKSISLSGLVLTKIDGDARGGAAISIRSVTGVPIKYLGTGEGLDALETFDPNRLASRILGMGDVIGLIEKAEAALDTDTAEKQAEKLLSGEFSLADFADQLRQVRKMGPIGQLLDMMPGAAGGKKISSMVDPKEAEKSFNRIEAIISSMTVEERLKPKKLNASRKRRIAKGSGTDVQDINRLLRQYQEMQNMMKRMKKMGGRGGLPQGFGW